MHHKHRGAAAALFVAGVAGVAVGAFAASKVTVSPAAWSGKEPAAAVGGRPRSSSAQ